MGNGLQHGCKCHCPGDEHLTESDMMVPTYPGTTSAIYVRQNEADGGTGGQMPHYTQQETVHPAIGCVAATATWCRSAPCCHDAETTKMVVPMSQPVLEPVYAIREKSNLDYVGASVAIPNEYSTTDQTSPDPATNHAFYGYAPNDQFEGVPLPLVREESNTSHLGYSKRSKQSSDRTSSSGGRTASEWAADQDQFSHLPPLPPGWLRVISRTTGKIYFCYPETGETTFTEPTGPPPSLKLNSGPPNSSNSKLPPGWVEMVSRSTGRTYYWNAELQKSQFDPPSCEGGSAAPASPAFSEDTIMPPGWVQMVSRSTGRTYYFNSETQQSQFDRPC